MDDRKEKRQITIEDFKTINPNKTANAVVTKNMSVDAPVDGLVTFHFCPSFTCLYDSFEKIL